MNNPLAQDLDHVLAQTEGLWEELRGRRIFITGGTGFFGCWLLESFAWANVKFGLNAQAVVLSRDAQAFARKAPHLFADQAITLHSGDVRAFQFPEGSFSHLIHAASALSSVRPADPAGMLSDTFHGLERVLELARRQGVRKMLYTSSGAVYGPATPGRRLLREEDPASSLPLAPRGAYAEAKRMVEMMGSVFAQQHGFEFKIARGFAFLGPYLPLDAHFAAGNFIRDALAGHSIIVRGSGSAVRSYLYAADLAVWLWRILFQGVSSRPYNVGSDVPVSVVELAHAVAKENGPATEVIVQGKPEPDEVVDYYVPDITRARTELGLQVCRGLSDAVNRTLVWHQQALKEK